MSTWRCAPCSATAPTLSTPRRLPFRHPGHWRLLQRIHAPGSGQLSSVLAALSAAGRDTLRHPHPDTLTVLDPRPFLDDAAAVAARYGGGLLVAETLVAGLTHGGTLWFGLERNVGRVLDAAAENLGIAVHVAPPP